MTSEPTARTSDAPSPPESAIAPERVSAFLAELARAPPLDLEGVFPAFRPGAVVGKFELIRELGRGGFGVVFEALDRELGRLVALKAVRPGKRATAALGEEWLRREAEAAAQLSHPNIITLHDFGIADGGPYLVLELLQGETLQDRLRRGPMPVPDAVRVSIEVARGLVHAHACGVLHRDLKPSNIFLTNDGAVKVLDFGLAHVLGTTGLAGGGTPGFMAPEQWRGEPEDARTDVFGAGAVLFQMLTGELPYAVSSGRSAALDPGPAPALRRPGIPRQLGGLVSSALAKEPGARPRSAQAWLEGLLAADRVLVRRQGPRRRLWAGLAIGALLALGAGLVWKFWPDTPGERIAVAVADFGNETGEPDLSGLSGMLITSLEQSPRLSVLTRSRMRETLRQLGRESAQHIDEGLAREIGRRAGTRALLLASIRRFDRVYAIELKALDPLADEYLFTLSERGTGKASIPGMIDRISERTRRELREKASEVRSSEVKVASALTSSLEAYQHYFAGVDCLNRPISRSGSWMARPAACAEELRQAISIDPTFALARYQLAVATTDQPELAGESRQAIEAALRHVDRLPPKEQALVRALAARHAGKDEEAMALYRKLVQEYPADKQVQFLAGDSFHHRGDLAAAVPYFQRTLELDPSFEWALDHLPQDLGRLGRRDELASLVARLSAMPPSTSVLHALARSHLWLGQTSQAVQAAERAVEAGGGSAALDDLVEARFATGDLRGAEAALHKIGAPAADARLAIVLAVQGRRREALQVLAGRGTPFPSRWFHYYRACLLTGDGDPGPVWREAREELALDPNTAPHLAIALAYLGDLGHAADLAARFKLGAVNEEIYRAMVAWRRGDLGAAKAGLRAAEEVDSRPDFTLPPSFLLAEVSAAAGEDAEAVEALLRYRSLPYFGIWQGWVRPRSFYLLAHSLERLGQKDRARQEIDGLLLLWKDADPDAKLLAEARALRSRLGSGDRHMGRPTRSP